MRTIHGFWARGHASAICAGVAFFAAAILSDKSIGTGFRSVDKCDHYKALTKITPHKRIDFG